jgi:phosphatidate cytidylyltransferase
MNGEKTMDKRYLGALFMSPFIIFLFLGGSYLKYGLLIISLTGLYEFYKTVKFKNINPISLVGYTLGVIHFLVIGQHGLAVMFFLVILANMIALCIPVIFTKYNFLDVAITIFGYIYIVIPFSLIYLVSTFFHGRYLIWLIFIASWACDTFAYYTGKNFGKTKLCPRVSPKKTVEGAFGGFIGSVAACGIYGIVVSHYVAIMPLYNYFIIGGICGVFCQFGDLTASSIKRHVGTKDFSNLIPGHGGILDRFDSILFASVIVYYYLTFIMVL